MQWSGPPQGKFNGFCKWRKWKHHPKKDVGLCCGCSKKSFPSIYDAVFAVRPVFGALSQALRRFHIGASHHASKPMVTARRPHHKPAFVVE